MTEEEKPVVKINKWDCSAVKNALDDAVHLHVKDVLNFDISHKLFDVRLFLSFTAVAFAGFALLWDWLYPFPKSEKVLIVCVAAYVAIMALLQAYMWMVEGNTFLVAIDRDARPERTFKFASSLQRYDHMYRLHAEVASNGSKAEGSFERSVASWFDENGKLESGIFEAEVNRLISSLSTDKKKK